MRFARHQRFGEWGILLLFSFAVLWKGGKSLETTWLLAGFATLITLWAWLEGPVRQRDDSRLLEEKNSRLSGRPEMQPGLWAACIAFVIWTAVSFLTSATRNYGLDEVLRTASYVLVFFWVARVNADERMSGFLWKFASVVTAVIFVASLAGVAVYALQPVSRFVGTFFDHRFHTDYWPNAWAQCVVLTWPIILLDALRHDEKKDWWMRFIALGFVLGALFLSYSRGAVIAFAGQLVLLTLLFFAIILRDIRYRRMLQTIIRRAVARVTLVILVAVSVFFAVNVLRSLTFDVQSVTEKVTFTAAEGTSSITERSQFWQQATALTLERPVTGWGPYSFRFTQPAAMQDVLATSDHPHNVLLKLASERGIPAAALFMFIVGYVAWLTVTLLFHARKSVKSENDATNIVLLSSVIGVLAHNMIDYNLQFVGVGLTFWMILGFLALPAMIQQAQTGASFRRWKLSKFLSRTTALCAFVVLVVATWEGAMLVTSSVGRHAQAAGEDIKALSWYRRSHNSLFKRDLHLSEAQIELRNGNLPEAGRALDRYQAVNALDPRLWKIRGVVELRNGNLEEAAAALEQAYERGRYTDLGITRVLLEAQRAAKQHVDYARKREYDGIFSDFAAAIENNTHFIALSENVEDLQAISRLLSAAFPTDAERYRTIARSAAANAREERERYEARSSGILW